MCLYVEPREEKVVFYIYLKEINKPLYNVQNFVITNSIQRFPYRRILETLVYLIFINPIYKYSAHVF